MRGVLVAILVIGLLGSLFFVAGNALGVWDPIEPAASLVQQPVTTRPAHEKHATGEAKKTHDAAAFRERADRICIINIPADFNFPLTSLHNARARARGYARLVRKLERVSPPPEARSEYEAMLAALDDLVSEVEVEVHAISGGLGATAITGAVRDATQASASATAHARKLRLGWCVNGLEFAA